MTLSSNVESLESARKLLETFRTLSQLSALWLIFGPAFGYISAVRKDEKYVVSTTEEATTIEEVCQLKVSQPDTFPSQRVPGELQYHIPLLAIGDSEDHEYWEAWGCWGNYSYWFDSYDLDPCAYRQNCTCICAPI